MQIKFPHEYAYNTIEKKILLSNMPIKLPGVCRGLGFTPVGLSPRHFWGTAPGGALAADN